MKKPVITYPCTWSYRLIGSDGDRIYKEIPGKMGDIEYTINPGNQSTGGKYVSVGIEAVVRDEAQRLSLLGLLRSIPTVKIVL